MLKKYSKRQIHNEIKNTLLVIGGCFFVAFGAALFIEPSGLVTGGVTTFGIIINTVMSPILGDFEIIDIVVWVMQILLWLLGLIFLGKKYAGRTLLATFTFPLFNTILLRFVTPALASLDIGLDHLYDGSTVSMLIVALFGGLSVGCGIGLSYLGNGSTGGLDTISVIVSKYSGIKEGIIAFSIDGLLVILGLFVYKNFVGCLLGVLSAIIMGIAIQFVYSNTSSHVIFEIISNKNDQIQEYIRNVMDHSTTEIKAVGGFSKEDKTILRAVIYHTEQVDLKKKIAEIDPDAFVVITTAKAIKGLGFDPLFLGHSTEKHKE